jgi:Tfp pilus assembly protein PilX
MSKVAGAGCRRRGVALIVVLAGMAVAAVMFLAATKLILVQRRTVELNSRQIQAGWLAESGVQRAAARLAADASYRGETWTISAEELDGRDDGAVTIRVEPVPGKPDRRAVHVQADYPSDAQQRVRETREATIRTHD